MRSASTMSGVRRAATQRRPARTRSGWPAATSRWRSWPRWRRRTRSRSRRNRFMPELTARRWNSVRRFGSRSGPRRCGSGPLPATRESRRQRACASKAPAPLSGQPGIGPRNHREHVDESTLVVTRSLGATKGPVRQAGEVASKPARGHLGSRWLRQRRRALTTRGSRSLADVSRDPASDTIRPGASCGRCR